MSLRRSRSWDLGDALKLLEQCGLPLDGAEENFSNFFSGPVPGGSILRVVGLEVVRAEDGEGGPVRMAIIL